jgi:hypothetical protein
MADYKPKPGELVRYTKGFLRAIGMHVGVPLNGMVLRLKSNDQIAVVRWCDRDENTSINVGNLEQCPSDKRIDAGMRECLMKEFGADGVQPYSESECC